MLLHKCENSKSELVEPWRFDILKCQNLQDKRLWSFKSEGFSQIFRETNF